MLGTMIDSGNITVNTTDLFPIFMLFTVWWVSTVMPVAPSHECGVNVFLSTLILKY